MITLIAFIVLMVGGINWFCIGLLQYDFVAGLFGSQASIFSRVIYVAVGLASLIILYNLIINKGKVVFNLRKNSIKEKSAELKENMSLLKSDNEEIHGESGTIRENANDSEVKIDRRNDNKEVEIKKDQEKVKTNKENKNQFEEKKIETKPVPQKKKRHNYLPSYAEAKLADAKIEAAKEQGYEGLEDYSEKPQSDTYASINEKNNDENYQSASEVNFNRDENQK